METHYFNYEKTPDVKILDALIMSICVPILFKPVTYENKLFVDGGLLSNYPIDYFTNSYKGHSQ